MADDGKAEHGDPCLGNNDSIHVVGASERKTNSGNWIYFPQQMFQNMLMRCGFPRLSAGIH